MNKFILITLLFLSFHLISIAQESAIDTSTYIPYIYEDAINFNLQIAAAKGYDSEVERLIQKGANVDFCYETGVTPLIYSVANNHISTAQLLINHDADVNVTTYLDETPLLISIFNNNFEMAETLIRAGAEINSRDNQGVAPLHYTALYGMNELTDLLIYYGADVDIRAYDNTTPLMVAIWASNNGVAELLMRYGANLEATDKDGFTPFMIAAQEGNLEMVKYLHDQNVDIYSTNNSNWNALALAIKTKKEETVKELIGYGNEWNTSTRNRNVDIYKVAAKTNNSNINNLLNESSIPGSYKSSIDQMSLSYSWLFNGYGLYHGINIKFPEPVTHIGLNLGVDTKMFKSKVIESMGDCYHQFYEKSTIIYGGVTKDFYLTKRLDKSNLVLTTDLNIGYYFRHKSDITDQEKAARLMPAIGLKIDSPKIDIFANVEYMKTNYLHVGPLWYRIGVSYSIFFDKSDKATLKNIKWK